MATKLVVKTVFDAVDKITAPLKKMTAGISSFGQKGSVAFAKIERRARAFNNSINKSFRGLKNIATLAGGLTLGMALSQGAQAFVDLDKNVTSAAAKMGVFDRTSQSFKDLRKAAMDVGAATEFTSGQAAEGLKYLALAGWDAKNAIAALPGLVNLATAAEIDLGAASDIATDSMGAFNLVTKDAEQNQKNLARVSDVLAKVTTSFNTDMVDLFEAVKKGGTAFTSAGGSIEEFGAITGIMANAGIKGSEAGTAIRRMMLNLQAPSGAVSKTLKKLNVNIDDGTGNMKSYSKIVSEIISGASGMTKIQQNAALSTLFGARAVTGATLTLNAGSEALDNYTKMLEDADGTSKQMADFMRGGLSGVLASMKSAFESIAIAIGDTFAPEIDAAIKKLTKIARGAKDWVSENKVLIKSIFNLIKWVVKIIIALKGFLLIVSIVNKVRNAFLAFKAVMIVVNAVMLANPIGLIIIVVVALIALITIIVKKWNDWGAAMSLFLGPLGVLISLVQSFRRNWEMITKAFKEGGILAGLKAIGATLFDAILMPVQQLMKLLSKIPGRTGVWAGKAMDGIQGLREKIGVNTTTDESGKPLNADAKMEKVRTERSEKTTNNKIMMDIRDNSGLASIIENTGNIPINLSKTTGL